MKAVTVVFAVLCVAVPLQGASIKNSVSIFSAEAENGILALTGWFDGGVSEIVDIRFPGCTAAPCQVSKGQAVNLEIDFKPRQMHVDMQHRGILMKETELVELSEGPLPDSTVQAGQLYTFKYPFTVQAPFSGTSEMRLKVYQNYVMEILISIPLNVA